MATILVAYDECRVIGNKGSMPWHIPADLRRFQILTTGGAVIMGRKTFESLPRGPLPDRTNIVISRDAPDVVVPEKTMDKVIWVQEPQAALRIAWSGGLKPWIIGGEQIYRHFLCKGLVHKVIATEVIGRHKGDVHFPRLHSSEGWSGELIEERNAYSVWEYLSMRALREERNDYRKKCEIMEDRLAAIVKEREDQSITIQRLRKKLRGSQRTLNAQWAHANRHYRDQQDYLNYPDDPDGR